MLDYLLNNFNRFSNLLPIAFFLLWLWLQAKIGEKFATRSAVSELNERVAEVETSGTRQERRLVVVENRLNELPDKDALHDLSIRTEKLGGDLKAVKASLDAIEASNRRIEDYLLNRKDG